MTKEKRLIIWQKFNGLCAYTGKPLDDLWQVDHLEPVIRKFIYIPNIYSYNKDGSRTMTPAKHKPDGFMFPERNTIDNMVPAIKIINHYKRGSNVEQFRCSLSNLHKRLKKLPKTTTVERTKKRILYIKEVAELFDITPDRPFSGVFYMETFQ